MRCTTSNRRRVPVGQHAAMRDGELWAGASEAQCVSWGDGRAVCCVVPANHVSDNICPNYKIEIYVYIFVKPTNFRCGALDT